jgi:hypothetical protein
MTVELLWAASEDATPGALHVAADTRRTRALLELEPVLDELERRAVVGLGAILSRSLLDALAELPTDVPVPLARLSAAIVAQLQTMPAGCVEFDGRSVVRHAVPAVRVLSAGVCSGSWADGLRQASLFASYCSRYAVLTSSRFDRERAQMEARFYGIGLATMLNGAESFTWLVEPEQFKATRQTTASWLFAESALDALAHSPDLARGRSERPRAQGRL